MMKKLGKFIPALHQLCYAHGLQLVIHDLFYEKQTRYTEEESDCLSETDQCEEEIFDEIEEDSDGLSMVIATGTQQEDSPMLKHDIYGIVNRVRKIVKFFKRSPLKNEILQNYAKEKHPNGLQLILDCKTRWSSLLYMLERFVKLKIPVQKALLDLNADTQINDADFTKISHVIQALDPIKIAVEALCRRDANFISAEATIKFLLDEVQNYPPSEYNNGIIEAIDQRSIQERYIQASVIIAYLHNPLAKLERKSVVKEFCTNLLSRLNKPENTEGIEIHEDIPSSNSVVSNVEMRESLTVAVKLQLAIDASLKKPQDIQPSDESLSSSLKYELNIAEQTGKRGVLLEKVYQMLLTVPPTSVESERIFSSCAYLCNRFRSSLSDRSLNTLCFIRNNKK